MNKISEIPEQESIPENPAVETSADPWRCEECGSLEVSYRTWVDSNTGQVAPAAPEQDDLWCDGCEEHTYQIRESELMSATVELWWRDGKLPLRRKNNLKIRAMNKNLIEKIAPQLTELMIKKMETLTEAWRKPWIADLAHGLPRNLRGTPYRGGNILMLLFLSEIAGYSTPLFMTFKQAKEEGLNILKGSGSFPVFFWKLYIRHKETRKKIELADYYRLPQEQRRQYDVLPVMRYYPVFNIDQTDMSEQQPERYASLTTPTGPKDYSDGLTCEVLDRMLAEQSWLCPILLKSGNRASYSPTLDRIVCPEKRQFPEGAAFYTTLLHEVTHSTGHAERLNRPFGACYRDADYIREELVAELTAALCGAMLGFATTPREESAAYIKDWLAEFRKEPTYLFDILTDVNRAARMISERLAGGEESDSSEAIPAEAA